MTKVLVNFSWIGPPAQIFGHDTQAVFQFLEQFNQELFSPRTHEIRFFCLKDYHYFYRKLYANHAITVIAMEDFLQGIIKLNLSSENVAHAKELLNLIKKLLITGRNSIRDRVTVKDVFHYFLAYYSGGYIFDTNIKPEQGFCGLPRREQFIISGLKGSSRPESINELDIFAMYSPAGDLIAREALEQNIHGLKVIEQESDDKTSAEYYKKLGKNVIKSVFEPWKKYEGEFWATSRTNERCYFFSELRVSKTQENTHQHVMRKTYERSSELVSALIKHSMFSSDFTYAFEHYLEEPDLEDMYKELYGRPLEHNHYHDAFNQIAQYNNQIFKAYIDNGLDLGMRVMRPDKSVENETLLHKAVYCGNIEACQLILNKKEGVALCFISMKIKDKGFEFTPLQLAVEIGVDDITALIKEKIDEMITNKIKL